MMTATPRKGYKQTEVGLIPHSWDVKKIEAITTEISMGPFGSDIKVSNFISSGVPVLSGANVGSQCLRDDFTNFVSISKAKSLKKAVARRGDVVVTHRGTLGQIAYIPKDSKFENYVISQSQFRVHFVDDVTPEWIVLYFHSSRGLACLLEGKGHTGVPAIAQPTTTFRKLFVPLPSLPEQEKISSTLSDVDALIDSLDALIAKKKDIKAGVMQELLTGKRRLSGFSGEWEETELVEVANFYDNLRIPVTESKRELGTTPYYGANGIQSYIKGHTHDGEFVLFAEDGANDLNNYPVLYVNGKVWVNNHAHVIQGISNKANTKYLSYALKAINFVQILVGGTRAKLNGSVAKAIKIRTPISVAEQNAIASVLSDIDKDIAALQQKRDKACALKQGMMQQLLTGNIRLR